MLGCLLAAGTAAQRFPALWFGTFPSQGFNGSELYKYDLSNYSLVMLGFTYPDPHNEATLQAAAAAVKRASGARGPPPPVLVYRNAHHLQPVSSC